MIRAPRWAVIFWTALEWWGIVLAILYLQQWFG